MANGFIHALKSQTGTLILFDCKLNSSFYLCVNYQKLYNLTNKNWYPLPLISEFLDQLSQAKKFTQLDLMSAYHNRRIEKSGK